MEITELFKQAVIEKYLSSYDFNGLPIWEFKKADECSENELIDLFIDLIDSDIIEINFDMNPHIKRLPLFSREKQIEKLNEIGIKRIVAYPSPAILQEVVDRSLYDNKPFTLRLALGEPQLTFVSFDLRVLEFYRNDPRFYYVYNDIKGKISYTENSASMLPERDKVFLESFGTAYDSVKNRAIGAFLRYLSKFNSEHQKIWQTYLLEDDYKMHPDYFRSAILGEWHEGVTIFTAFVEEIRQINILCELMAYPPLFNNEFHGEQRPKEFAFLIRPTSKEFNSFVLLLDKMLSENLNKNFSKMI